MAESLQMTKKKVIKRTLVETEETYELVNENNPTDSGKPPSYSKDPPDPPDDPVRPREKRITGELGEASLPSLFDIYKQGRSVAKLLSVNCQDATHL